MSPDPGVVDQILISWSERTLTEGRGVGPTASSIRAKAELAMWERRLLAADWAAAEVGTGASRPALVYLQFGQEAAVLRKRAVADPHGRPGSTLAHALVGHVSDLPAQVALGLYDWPGWVQEDPAPLGLPGGRDEPGGLAALNGRELRLIAEGEYQALRACARSLDPGLLAALFTTLLSDPAGRFSLYPAADAARSPDDEGALVTRLLCGVLDVIGDAVDQAWTFSTCEAEEPAAGSRPRLVFLSQAPGFSTRAPTGNRARIGELGWFGPADSGGQDVLQVFSQTLAETFTWSPAALSGLRPRGQVRSAPEAIAWAGNAEFAPGVRADFGLVLVSIGQGRTDRAVLDRVPAQPDALAAGVRALPADLLTQLATLWGPGTAGPASCPEVATALHREVAWRVVTGTRMPAAAAVSALAVSPATWAEELIRYRAQLETRSLAGAVSRVAAFGVPGLGQRLGQLLAGLPADELLALGDEFAVDLPELSAELLGVLAGRGPMPGPERTDCISQLAQRAFMVGTLERCFPNDPAGESEVLQRLLTLILIPELDRLNVEGLVTQVSHIGSAPLLHALAAAMPPGMRERVLVAAGQVWFQDNGLPPLPALAPPAAEPDQPDRPGSGTPPGSARAPDPAHAPHPADPTQPAWLPRLLRWLLHPGGAPAGPAEPTDSTSSGSRPC